MRRIGLVCFESACPLVLDEILAIGPVRYQRQCKDEHSEPYQSSQISSW